MVTLAQYLGMQSTQRKNVKKEDLHRFIDELHINDVNNGPTNADIMQELLSIRSDINEIMDLKETTKIMRDEIDTAYDIINSQMRFLETIDSKERGKNVIITGIVENSNLKLEKQVNDVISATGYVNANLLLNEDDNDYGLFINEEKLSVKRLGKARTDADPTRPRAVLLQVTNKKVRDDIVACASTLKGKEGYIKIYIKKDVHPAIRKEQGRQRKRLYDEKNNPQNADKTIVFDWKRRVIICDEKIIDRFCPNF